MSRVTSQENDRVTRPPNVPRASATVLLLRDDPFEVLMVARAAHGAFASALVFPGGAIDPGDRDPVWRDLVEDYDSVDEAERPVRIGGIRELWEETGILLADGGAPERSSSSLASAAHEAGARLRLDSLTHFGHWITPVTEPRRFDTHFFLARMPPGAAAEPDGVETLAAEWIAPSVAARLARSGERPIIFPTMLNLDRLAESTSSEEAIMAARSRPRITVAPVSTVQSDGSRLVTIPADAGYSVTEWRQ